MGLGPSLGKFVVVAVEFGLLVVAFRLAYEIRFGHIPVPYREANRLFIPLLLLLYRLLLNVMPAQISQRPRWSDQFTSIVMAMAGAFTLGMAASFVARVLAISRPVLFIAWVLSTALFLVVGRLLWFVRERFRSQERLLVVAAPDEAQRIASRLSDLRDCRVVGFIVDEGEAHGPGNGRENGVSGSGVKGNGFNGRGVKGVGADGVAASGSGDNRGKAHGLDVGAVAGEEKGPKVFARLSDVDSVEAVLRAGEFDMAIIGASLDLPTKAFVAERCLRFGRRFGLVPDLYEILIWGAGLAPRADIPVLDLTVPSLGRSPSITRRALDILGASIGLLLTLPLWPFIALAIKIESPHGPVLYRQDRIGVGGREFTIYKFRTMVPDAETGTGPVLSVGNDSRVTRVGRVLRAMRLDEVPQFLNVLRGDMTLIGPRPERDYFVRRFMKRVPNYRYRLEMPPGLTGLAQVLGRYSTSPEDKLRMDLLYARQKSFATDVRILMATIAAALDADRSR